MSKSFRSGAWALVVSVGAASALLACGGGGGGSGSGVVIGGGGGTATPPEQPKPFTVKMIGFNDYHGNLESPGTFGAKATDSPRPAVGGAEYLAGYVASLKAKNPLNVVVGAGDLVSASPLISSLFFDEPAVETLNRIGLEFSAVGNHEFDRGSAELLRLQKGGCKMSNGAQDANSCKGAAVGTGVPFEGARYQWLSANVISSSTGKTLLPAYGVKEFKGVKVAFVGMTLKDTPAIVSPSGVAGLAFQDEADTVNKLIPQLKEQGINAVIVLVHQGGFQTGSVADINGCEGSLAGSDIEKIVNRLDDGVDMVVSAHTHAAYNCQLSNAKGRKIPVTSASAFGRVLTDVDLTLDPSSGRITAIQASNVLVDRTNSAIQPDSTVQAIVGKYKELVSPIANVIIGSIAADLSNSRVDGACNMPAGELVADAQLAATQPAQFGGAVMAFMNGGGVRNPGFVYKSAIAGVPDGSVTYGQAFTVQPFGNSLVTMDLTAQNLKDFLEEQFAGCLGQAAASTRFAVPSAGVKYAWDGSKACGARISNFTLTTADGSVQTIVDAAGTVVNPAAVYRVTVNNFMADGGDGFSTLRKGTNRQGGAQDIDALSGFLANYKAPKPAYARLGSPLDAGTARISRIGSTSKTCPGGANPNP